MIAIASWYVLVTLIGWLAWPLGFRHLRALPDRGYLFSRVLGLLLVAYTFWILASLGLVANTPGAMLLALIIVAGLAAWQYRARPDQHESLRDWLHTNRRLVLLSEALFLLAFVAWAIVRAHDPNIQHTEKPMELTFLNGIRGSATFPPRDPWLANFAISYYYFGYVMVAMLADLSGIASGVAFNVGVALIFALTMLSAYAVVYNLIALSRQSDSHQPNKPALLAPLLGPLFVAIMGNLQGALELLHALRLVRAETFWTWLDVADLNAPLPQAIAWPPSTWRNWWWWRASRVIHERDLTGTPIGLQPIDEFPAFSFVLGDLHPHVLVLPFVLLAIGLALNLLANREERRQTLDPAGFIIYALGVGALAFLNTWDLPIYLFIVVAAESLRTVRRTGKLHSEALGHILTFTLGLTLLSIAFYLPFYIGFSSQASGILPNVIFPTRFPNFVVMFGPLLFIILWYLVAQAAPLKRGWANWLSGTGLAVSVLLVLAGIMALGGWLALRQPGAQDFLLISAGHEIETLIQRLPYDSPQRAAALEKAIDMALARRVQRPWVALLLTSFLALGLSRLLRNPHASPHSAQRKSFDFSITDFVLLLIITGTLLTLGPEFVYLRDNFGQRLNTVFKFYYAAWILFSIAAAYAVWHITTLHPSRTAVRGTFATVASLLVVAGLAYPALAIPTKADFTARPSLDGIAYIGDISRGDLDAIEWLQSNAEPDAIILEAIGGQYTLYGRVSTTTGLPTLLGWPGHELQWRGSMEAAGTRENDVRQIYTTRDIRTAQSLLEQYNVTYIFVGSLEKGYDSPVGLDKFARFLTTAYDNGEAAIYRADQPLPAETQ